MIKITTGDTANMEGVFYTVEITNDELIKLKFTDLEAQMIRKANEGILTPTLMACVLLMITRKIEAQQKEEAKNG